MGFTADNYAEVEARVRAACERVGRDRSEVTLIAVSKTKPLEQVCDLIAAGVRDFGENKVQELTGKQDVLAGRKKVSEDTHVPAGEADAFDVPAETASAVRWHLIGHLQRNKVKYIVGRAALIHSVDSLRLAQEIEKEAVKLEAASGAPAEVPVLIEVNIGNEESKTGVAPEEFGEFYGRMGDFSALNVRGIMTMAPKCEKIEDFRAYFRKSYQIYLDFLRKKPHNIGESVLSMGMSDSFECAVEEGSNLVRVGSAIFGARSYPAAT